VEKKKKRDTQTLEFWLVKSLLLFGKGYIAISSSSAELV
jgi:hypothetical protein